MDSIADLISAYDASEGKLGVSALKELLKELRKSKVRRPDIVYDNWMRALNSEKGNEVFALYEQVCIAALDEGDTNLASECIGALLKTFPDSARVGRLLGMQKEQAGKFEDALEIYTNLLKKNPANLMILKRKVCVFKAMGDQQRLADELNAILRQFPGESSTWAELGDLYLSLCDVPAAAHCFEELVLLNPISAPHHARLAEVYYSLGGFENLVRARKHYALSLQQQCAPHNLRAVYGLVYTCRAIAAAAKGAAAESEGSSSADRKEREHELRVTAEMLSWAQGQLAALANESTNSSIQTVLDAIQS